MSDHQPDYNCEDEPAEAGNQAVQVTAPDPHEPDFSRLRLARASLDTAFPAE